MRVVLDTNVLISALLFHAHVSALFDLIEDDAIIPCFTPLTLQEFEGIPIFSPKGFLVYWKKI